MKNKYFSSKEFKFSTLFVFAIAVLGFLSSCKKEDDENEQVAVNFVVTGDDIFKMKAVVTQVGTQQTSQYTFEPDAQGYKIETQLVNTNVGAVHLSATADGMNADSELVVSIFVNGEMKATDTAKGIDLVAKTMADIRP